MGYCYFTFLPPPFLCTKIISKIQLIENKEVTLSV